MTAIEKEVESYFYTDADGISRDKEDDTPRWGCKDFEGKPEDYATGPWYSNCDLCNKAKSCEDYTPSN